jgi:hypothetical protein
MSVEHFVQVKILEETWLVEIEYPLMWDEPVVFRVNHLSEVTAMTPMAQQVLENPNFLDMITSKLKNHMNRDGTDLRVII